MIVIEAGVHPAASDDEFCAWLSKQGINPQRCYRAVIDGNELTALCYAEDFSGRKYVIKDPKLVGYKEAAVEEPVTVTHDNELPAILRKA